MKKILITQSLSINESYYEERELLDSSWGKLFQEIDLMPIILPYEYDFKKYFHELDIDGIFLTGGNDLNNLNANELSFKRDTYENKLIEYAIENKIAIFGVCRGMQVIAEYFSSTFKAVSEQVNVEHSLNINNLSKYEKLLNKIKKVNSFHNYAVDNISKELIVSARSTDGIIKAIEHKEYKVFGQMWHSERQSPFIKEELELIRDFFDD